MSNDSTFNIARDTNIPGNEQSDNNQIGNKLLGNDSLRTQTATEGNLRNIQNKASFESASKTLPPAELADGNRIGHQGPITTTLDKFGHLVSKSIKHDDGRPLTIDYKHGVAIKLTRPDGSAFVKNDKGTWDFTSPEGKILWNARKFTVKMHDNDPKSDTYGSVTYKVNNTSEKLIDADGKYHDLGKISFKPENTTSKKTTDNQRVTTKDDITQKSEVPGGNVVALSLHPEIKQQWVKGKDPTYQGKSLSDKPVEVSASYYADYFHGRKTSSGERFNMNKMTCAYIGLPFGTELEVTNKNTGKSCIVRINDHGPYHGNRVIDLSKAAMKKIGGLNTGVVSVTARVLNRLKHKPE